jgi:hypothetical protein
MPQSNDGARDGHILEAALDEREDLVEAARRLNELRVRAQMCEQKVLMRTQSEEPVGLRHALDLERGVQRTSPGIEVALGAKGLASDAVPAVIAVLVERIGMTRRDSADEMRHAGRVVRRRGAHESVVRDA